MGDEEKKTKVAKQEAKLQKCKAKFDEEQEQLEFDRFWQQRRNEPSRMHTKNSRLHTRMCTCQT